MGVWVVGVGVYVGVWVGVDTCIYMYIHVHVRTCNVHVAWWLLISEWTSSLLFLASFPGSPLHM